MRKSVKYKLKEKRKIWIRRGIISILIASALYIFAFVRYSEVNYETAEKHNVTISNVQFNSLSRGPYWVTFSTQIGDCYAELTNPQEDRDTIKQLSDSRKNVSIVVTDKNHIINHMLYYGGRTHIVDIRNDEQVYINIDDYNNQLFGIKITCIVFATLILLIYNGITLWDIRDIMKT